MNVSGLPSYRVQSHGAVPRDAARLSGSADATASPSASPQAQGDTITVATFNAENVFLVPTMGRDGKMEPPKSPEEMAAVARVIQHTGADVVALQEINDKNALDTLVDKYMTGNPYPYRVLVPGNDQRGINVAVLSKFPITNVESNAGDSFDIGGKQGSFSRDFLEATIKVNDNFEFTIGTTHLKAQAGGHAADEKRLGEGRQIHKILVDHMKSFPQKRYVVCGDFNDTAESPAVRAITAKGQNAELFDPLAGSSDVSHPVTNRRIDFLLLSDGMKQAYVPSSAQIVHDPDAEKASDHLPVVARFRI